MNILALIFFILFLVIVLLTFVRTKWSLALFIAYSILVPVMEIRFGGIYANTKVMYGILIFLYAIKYRRRIKHISYSFFTPFILFFALQLFFICFQPYVLFIKNWNLWLQDVMTCVMFPMILYSAIRVEKMSARLFLMSLLVSGAIFLAYGLFLTTMPGINPYLIVSLPVFGREFNETYALGYSALMTNSVDSVADGRMFGRISSVFAHPMTYGLNIGLLTLVALYSFKKKHVVVILLSVIAITAIFTSGIRTPIAAFVLTIIVGLLNLRSYKTTVYVAATSFLLLWLLPLISPQLNDFVNSILGSESKVSGSNMDMRIVQLYGCFDIIEQNTLFGNGYCWTTEYTNAHTVHPVLLGFESLLFKALCNTGVAGVLSWVLLVFMFYKMCHRQVKYRLAQTLLLSLFSYYVIFSLITGDYGYMRYFMIYYSIALGFGGVLIGIKRKNVHGTNVLHRTHKRFHRSL